MSLRHHCILCDEPILPRAKQAWPDYLCMVHYQEYGLTLDGTPIAARDYPAWLRLLWRAETARRMRASYWRKRGVDIDLVPFSSMTLFHGDIAADRDECDVLAALGEQVLLAQARD